MSLLTNRRLFETGRESFKNLSLPRPITHEKDFLGIKVSINLVNGMQSEKVSTLNLEYKTMLFCLEKFCHQQMAQTFHIL